MPERNKTILILFVLSFSFLFSVNSYSQTSQPSSIIENNDTSDDDKFSMILHKLGFTGIGLDALAGFRDGYDTGLGTAIRLPRKFYFPDSETYTSLMFMGASNDSLDIDVLGIEESLILSRTHHRPFIVIMGLTAGYYFTSEEHRDFRKKTKDEYFNLFLVLGAKYELKSKSIISQLKYGMRKDFTEIHIALGINFYE